MNRIEKAFHSLKENNRKAFVPYLMAGDGGLDQLMDQLIFLENCGATAIEIGIPFSDPVADGPAIQEAGIRALNSGTSLKEVLLAIQTIRPIVSTPLILMTYMNPIYSYGIGSFIHDAVKAGIDGCIIPDLPIEEEELLAPYLNEAKIELIRLVTLTSPIERIEEIAKKGRGFLYAVTVTGITGARTEFNETVADYLKEIKRVSPIPVLAGFGISTPDQVVELGSYCDGVVVGSKIVQFFNEKKLNEIKHLIEASKAVDVS